MSKYDVIIIGSGLGGLSCGVLLSKEGKRVCVVEKEAVAGGCLRSFRRDGVPFDTGIHYVGSLDDGQILNHFLRYCGVYDNLRLKRLDDDGFDVIHLDGREFRFCMGYDRFVESLTEQFPGQRRQLTAYATALREVGNVIGVEKLRQGVISSGGVQYMSIPASARINSLINDPLLRRVLCGASLLYDGVRDYTPFYHQAMISHSFITGAYRFEDGSQQLADALCETIRHNGGEVRCAERVTAVCQQNNRVLGVQLASGEILEAKEVLSDVHPVNLLPMITPGNRIRPSYAARIKSAQNSIGVFSLFATLDKHTFPYQNRNHYLIGNNDVWGERGAARPRNILFSMQAHTADQACEAATLLCPMEFSEVENWEQTTIGKRGAAYEEFKQEAAQKLIRVAETHLPGFSRAIRSIHTATPLTFRDYTGTPEGSAYGMSVDCNNVLGTLPGTATKIEGLYLTGQNVAVHGALGVVMTAIATCGAMLGEPYIAHKIGNF